METYENENGKLNIKIILPDSSAHHNNNCHNSNNSMDKHTEADEQMNHAMIDNYD